LHGGGGIDKVRECDGPALREASNNEAVGGASGFGEERNAQIVNGGDRRSQGDGVRPVVVDVVPEGAAVTLVLWFNDYYEPLFVGVEQCGTIKKWFGPIAVTRKKYEHSIGALRPTAGASQCVGH